MKKKKKKTIPVLIVLLVLALLAGLWLRSQRASQDAQTNDPLADYNIESVQRRTIVESVSGSGTVVAGATESVRCDVTGADVKAVFVHEGDRVNAGDLIAQLDTSDLEERLASLRESYSDTVANRAEQNQTYDQRIWDSVTGRQERADNLSRQIEETRVDIETSEEELAQAQEKEASLQQTVDERQAAVDEISAQIAQAQAELEAEQTAIISLQNQLAQEQQKLGELKGGQARADAATDAEQVAQGTGGVPAAEDQDSRTEEEIEAEIASIREQISARQGAVEAKTQTIATLRSQLVEQEGNLPALQQNLIQQQSVTAQKESALRSARSRLESLETQLGDLGQENDDALTDARKSYNENAADSLESIQEQIDTVSEQIASCTVRASIPGVVTSVSAEEGSRYSGGTLAVVENTDQFFIEAQVDEYDIPDVSEGMEARIKTDATRDEILNGVVTFVAPSASSGGSDLSDLSALAGMDLSSMGQSSSGSEASFLVRIALDEQNARLRLGMTAAVSIIVRSAPDVWTVPYEAVNLRDDGTAYLLVVDEDALEAAMAADKEEDAEDGTVPKDASADSGVLREMEVSVGLEGTYYTQVEANGLSEETRVAYPKATGTDTLNELMNMMGSDGGI